MSTRIRIQADEFFNAYRVLGESNAAFLDQVEKSDGKPQISAKAFGSLPAMSPSIVCLAFSVELYIKDLHFALEGKAPRGHNILKLYQGLPKKVRQEIFAHNSISGNPFVGRGSVFSIKNFTGSHTAYDGFIERIEEISNGFEKWRYSYESVALKYEEWFALAFIEAIKSAAATIRTQSTAQVKMSSTLTTPK
ncbi:MAG: hypothetical protein KBF91_04410 [Alphaproteobacteria bacterium]|jgi:hypothetical protein|nr:hypothetical protein [Alphaproteobacteria bacterium]